MLLACVIGIPFGEIGTSWLLQTIANAQGFAVIHTTFQPIWLFVIVPSILCVGLLGGLLPARRAARVPVVETLRKGYL